MGPGLTPRRRSVSIVEVGIAPRAHTTTTSKGGTVYPLLARAVRSGLYLAFLAAMVTATRCSRQTAMSMSWTLFLGSAAVSSAGSIMTISGVSCCM